jgi:hypothetical protein
MGKYTKSQSIPTTSTVTATSTKDPEVIEATIKEEQYFHQGKLNSLSNHYSELP